MARRQFFATLMMSVAFTVQAAGTAAGTAVSNQARVNYTYGAQSLFVDSNIVTFRVDAILDVSVSGPPQSVRGHAGAGLLALPFTVTNTGNFSELFEFEVQAHLPGDDFDPVEGAPLIYFDSDGSGGWTTADRPFVPGSGGRRIEPDESIDLLVLAGIPIGANALQRGFLDLGARGLTGTGTPGATFVGRGPNGVDVVAGDGGGSSSARAIFEASSASFSLSKSVAVEAGPGGVPQRGTRLNYRLDVLPLGTGIFRRVVVRDAIPGGTRYVPGSLRLDGTALSDADDSDPGQLIAGSTPAIQVDLSELVPDGKTRNVEFSVIVE